MGGLNMIIRHLKKKRDSIVGKYYRMLEEAMGRRPRKALEKSKYLLQLFNLLLDMLAGKKSSQITMRRTMVQAFTLVVNQYLLDRAKCRKDQSLGLEKMREMCL